MSYQVIARKWRPQSFQEMVGQSHITQTLRNALHNNRLPHALLFTGPRGTGKTSSARILAKSIRCPQATDFVPCNQCLSCQEITAGSSPDVRELDAASNNGVDDMRDLLGGVMHMPVTGRYKIYIIDEVHMLSTSAFNALLKTLEEPPAHVIFILATTEVQKIPQTILSRCQRFDFRRIPTRQITERLKLICDTDQISYDEEALWLIARQGDGSLRDSQSLLDQVISFTNGQLTKALVTDVLGLTDRGLLLEALKAIIHRDPPAILSNLENIARSGFEPKILTQDLLESIRNMLIIKVSGPEMTEILELPDSELKALAELAAVISQEDMHFLFDMALKGAQDIARAQDPRLVMEMLFLRMVSSPHIVELKSILQQSPAPGRALPEMKIEQKKKFDVPPIIREKTPEAVKPAPPPSAPKPVATTPQTPQEKWLDFVEKVREKEAMFAAKIENLIFSKIEDRVIYVGVPPKLIFLREQMKDSELRRKLKSFIDSYWGPGYSIETQMSREAPQGESAQGIAQKKKELHDDEIKNLTAAHPQVKAAQRAFNGKITSVAPSKKESL